MPEPPTISTGYYHMISKATARKEHLYNDAAHTGNGNRLTLQSDSKVTTNNGIWHITSLGGGKVAVKNGDGNPLAAGGTNASLMGTYPQLTIASTLENGGITYYYFDAALMDHTATVNIDYKAKFKTFFVKMGYIAEGVVVLSHNWEKQNKEK